MKRLDLLAFFSIGASLLSAGSFVLGSNLAGFIFSLAGILYLYASYLSWKAEQEKV